MYTYTQALPHRYTAPHVRVSSISRKFQYKMIINKKLSENADTSTSVTFDLDV